jgi:hypothetical protein
MLKRGQFFLSSGGQFAVAPDMQKVPEGFAEDAIPLFQRVQLLRTVSQPSQEAGDTDIGSPSLVAHAMGAALMVSLT